MRATSAILANLILSQDLTVGRTGQPYGYAYGNPVNVVDPAGLEGGSDQQIPTGVGGIFELMARAGAGLNADAA